ncbi:MAG: O-antigen ligase family protein [Elusimicrobia bacterium]|nr:O-antigen ligase family protein [Elusimicrobiota bacterium]
MQFFIIFLSVLLAAVLGRLVTTAPHQFLIIASISVIISIIAFFSPKLSLVLLIFSMLLSPEISVGALIGHYRSVVFRYDDILLVVIFLSWFARTAIFKTKAFITETPVQTPMLLYTAVCVLSTAMGIFRGEVRYDVAVFYVLKYIEYFLLYFMTVNIVETKEEAKKYIHYGLAVAFIVSIYAFYYYLNSGADARATGPFEAPIGRPQDSEPASLGGYYLIVFGIFLGLLGESSGAWFRWPLFSLAFMFPVFLFTLSRASYIGLLFSLGALLAVNRKRKLFLIGLIIAGFIAISLNPVISSRTKERIEYTYKGTYATEVFETPFGVIKLEPSASQRVGSWKRSISYWLPKHPIIGNGVTRTGLVDAQIPLIIGELGIIGLALWLWMIFVIFRTSWWLYKNTQDGFVKGIDRTFRPVNRSKYFHNCQNNGAFLVFNRFDYGFAQDD